ncbi:MAG: ABC transporter ATP-binding protein [Anaerolineae bacterium]
MLLEVRDVSTYYGQIHALKEVSLRVDEGEIVTLIGANGAGKTTLLRTISGFEVPRAGDILFKGRSIGGVLPEKIVALGISHVPERRQIFAPMSVMDNLILGAYHRYRRNGRQAIQKDLDLVFEIFPVLKERRQQAAGTLSGGEQQMLAVGRGLMARPRLLLLDEPSLGLAPLLVRELFEVVAELRERGTTILLAEQNARAALQVADRGYVLEVGHVVLHGTARELIDTELVQRAYLGSSTKKRRDEYVLE